MHLQDFLRIEEAQMLKILLLNYWFMAALGVNIKMWVGDTSQTITMLSGVNDGSIWLDDYASYDKISIGSLIRNSGIDYSNIEWCFSGYFPYVDDATTLEIIAILKTKYGI